MQLTAVVISTILLGTDAAAPTTLIPINSLRLGSVICCLVNRRFRAREWPGWIGLSTGRIQRDRNDGLAYEALEQRVRLVGG